MRQVRERDRVLPVRLPRLLGGGGECLGVHVRLFDLARLLLEHNPQLLGPQVPRPLLALFGERGDRLQHKPLLGQLDRPLQGLQPLLLILQIGLVRRRHLFLQLADASLQREHLLGVDLGLQGLQDVVHLLLVPQLQVNPVRPGVLASQQLVHIERLGLGDQCLVERRNRLEVPQPARRRPRGGGRIVRLPQAQHRVRLAQHPVSPERIGVVLQPLLGLAHRQQRERGPRIEVPRGKTGHRPPFVTNRQRRHPHVLQRLLDRRGNLPPLRPQVPLVETGRLHPPRSCRQKRSPRLERQLLEVDRPLFQKLLQLRVLEVGPIQHRTARPQVGQFKVGRLQAHQVAQCPILG